MPQYDDATKKSLFVQAAWYDSGELQAHLEHVRLYHRDPSKDDYIYNLVLDEVGDAAGNLHTHNLDLIAPYFPGGPLAAFDNLFVGSHFINWTGPGMAYYEGMKDAGHRWANLVCQKAIWQAFKVRYPQVFNHWYINHEGVLDYFERSGARAAYEAYLIQSVLDANTVHDGRAVMWAPAIWSGVPLTSAERSAIQVCFSNVDAYSPQGIKWLHFQDCLGRGWPGHSLSDVKTWYQQLAGLHGWHSLRVDMEMFQTFPDGSIGPGVPQVIRDREDYYEAHGVPVGASWEMRWWFPTHQDL